MLNTPVRKVSIIILRHMAEYVLSEFSNTFFVQNLTFLTRAHCFEGACIGLLSCSLRDFCESTCVRVWINAHALFFRVIVRVYCDG